MDEPLFAPDEYPSDYAERAQALWASLAAANPAELGDVISLGWGSAHFKDYELRLSVSPPPQFVLTAQVIPLKPADPIQLTGHSYSWTIGPWSEVDNSLIIQRTVEMLNRLSAEEARRALEG